jgi:nucleoside-diphosphate-sugar epimerase
MREAAARPVRRAAREFHMRLFVTGATGTLGRPTVQALLAAGHEVRALARSDGNVRLLAHLGAAPVSGDLFDADALRRAMAGSDAVLHLATKIPAPEDAAKAGAWRENDRIRAEGTRLLVDAARAAGVGAFVYPSITFLYADGGDRWLDATSAPLAVPPMLQSALVAEQEVQRFAAGGGRGVVLRLGAFYGPDAPNSRWSADLARRGIGMVIGPDGAYWSHVWVDDAAAAVAAAAERAPAGLNDVVAADPPPRREVATAVARAVGRSRLWRPPVFAVRLLAGRDAADFAARSQRVSNRRFREATGWAPTVRHTLDGWRRIGEALAGGREEPAGRRAPAA